MKKRSEDPSDLEVEDLRKEEDRLCSVHHKWLKELFIAIRGNGDVKHGLEYKVQTLLDNQAVIVKLVWIVAACVMANAMRVFGVPLIDHIVQLAAHAK